MGIVNRNDAGGRRKSECRGHRRFVDRPTTFSNFSNLAETADSRPLPSSHDGNAVMLRALSSMTKKSVSLTPPVRKRDASTSHGVSVKARTVLPRLPVPPLGRTLDRYLQSIRPFLLQDDLRGGPDFESAYQQRVRWVKEFETGIGATLQARLVGTR